MHNPLAAVPVVFLAAALSAQPRASAVKTQFGPIQAGWVGVFTPMLGRDDIKIRVYPRGPEAGAAEDAVEPRILRNLAPVAHALESVGLRPEAFSALDSTAREEALRAALKRANLLIVVSLDEAMAGLRDLRDLKGDAAALGMLEGFDELAAGYFIGSQRDSLLKKIARARQGVLEAHNRRLQASAELTAQALGKTSEEDSPTQGRREASASAGERAAALGEIAALEARLKNSAAADIREAVSRLRRLGETVEDEAVGRAALRVIIVAVGAAQEQREDVKSFLSQAASVARHSRFSSVKRLGMHALLDNTVTGRNDSSVFNFRIRAVEHVAAIAESTEDAAVKGDARALLVREQGLEGVGGELALAIGKSIDRVTASAKGADLPYPDVGGKAVSELGWWMTYFVATILAEATAAAGLAFLAQGGLFPILALVAGLSVIVAMILGAASGVLRPNMPWYRKPGGQPPDIKKPE